MEALAESGQRVVDLYEIETLSLAPDEAAVALTFDDGYRDVLENALPVLREHGFPSTVFVVPGAMDGASTFSWYPPGAMPALAGWDELRAEERAGLVRFEPHTLTHPILTTLSRGRGRARDRGLEGRRRARARAAGEDLLLPGRVSLSARDRDRARDAACAQP